MIGSLWIHDWLLAISYNALTTVHSHSSSDILNLASCGMHQWSNFRHAHGMRTVRVEFCSLTISFRRRCVVKVLSGSSENKSNDT
ncbi:hypothetical protein BJV74DRAFT_862350 [Russula compacta]|nr:hypothetical protein BJV74DRAFT_862350 [Russula compacta]